MEVVQPPWRGTALAACEARGLLLAAWTLTPDGAPAWAGLHLTPTARLLALPGWRDAEEGEHDGLPWLTWEVERGVRMLLRQSWTAMELAGAALAGRASGEPTWAPWREALIELLPGALTAGAVHAALDLAAGLAAQAGSAAALRPALTALRLAEEGQLTPQLPELLPWAAGHPAAEARDAAALLAASAAPPSGLLAALERRARSTPSPLPAQPAGYAALSRFMVQLRLAGPAAP